MKKFIKNITLFFLLLAGCSFVLFVGLWMALLSFSNKYKDSLYSCVSHEINVKDSYERINKCKTTKIVIVGGSNTSFGINSNIIAEYFHQPVYNTSAHAGLGLRLQIELFKDMFEENDIILVMPEYAQFYNNLFWGDETMLRIISTYPRWIHKLSFRQFINSFVYISNVLESSFNGRFANGFDGAYSKKSLNEYGDISIYRTHKNFEPAQIEGDMNLDAFRYLNKFIKECKSTVLIFPQVCQDKTFDKNIDKIKVVDSILTKNDIGFASAPIRYRLADSLMFDGPGHCTSEGAVIRTKMVIEDMQRILGN